MIKKSATNPVSGVKRAIEVLEFLKQSNGANITEVSQELDISLSTAHRHISTLEESGFVVKEGGTYHIGLKVLEYGGFARNRRYYFQNIKPVIDELAEETGEAAAVAAEEQGRAIYLYQSRSRTAVRTDAYPGIQLNMHCTGAGKLLLAYQPREKREEIIDYYGLPKFTSYTITSKQELRKELEEIRERAVSFDDQERLDGMRGVATPVWDQTEDTVVGAITVAGPTKRISGDRFREELPDLLRRTSKMIKVDSRYR